MALGSNHIGSGGSMTTDDIHMDTLQGHGTPTKGIGMGMGLGSGADEYFVPKCMALSELFVPNVGVGSTGQFPVYSNSNGNGRAFPYSATLPRQRPKTVTFEDEKVSKESPDVFK